MDLTPFNPLEAYAAFRNALTGGWCELIVRDCVAGPPPVIEFRWYIRASRDGREWVFANSTDLIRLARMRETAEQYGKEIAAVARASFARAFPTVTADPPAGYYDSAY